MARVVAFGSAAVDLVLRVDAMPPPGAHIAAEPLGWRLGGSAANVACALSSAGHDVVLVSPIGSDDVAALVMEELQRRGVDTSAMVREQVRSPAALVFLDSTGERTIVAVRRGGDIRPEACFALAPALMGADCVFVQDHGRYSHALAPHASSALLVATPASIVDGWPADLVIGSEAEFPQDILDAPLTAARRLSGPRVRWVVVTRGSAGADAFGRTGTLHVDARPARQVDATGAGDAFAAGLLHALLKSADMADAMSLGAVWGAACVEQLRSVPPDWDSLFS